MFLINHKILGNGQSYFGSVVSLHFSTQNQVTDHGGMDLVDLDDKRCNNTQ